MKFIDTSGTCLIKKNQSFPIVVRNEILMHFQSFFTPSVNFKPLYVLIEANSRSVYWSKNTILTLYLPNVQHDIFTIFFNSFWTFLCGERLFPECSNLFLFCFENIQLSYDIFKHNNIYGCCVVAPVSKSFHLGKPWRFKTLNCIWKC